MNRRVAAPRRRPAVWRAGLALGLAALPSIAVANWTWQGQNGLIYDSNTNPAARSDPVLYTHLTLPTLSTV